MREANEKESNTFEEINWECGKYKEKEEREGSREEGEKE